MQYVTLVTTLCTGTCQTARLSSCCDVRCIVVNDDMLAVSRP